MKNVTFHPACKLFPLLPEAEMMDFAVDIRKKGLQHAIVLLEGKILDGRNRYLACKIAKVKPKFVRWKGTGSPVEWVIRENLFRRHLSSSQRAVIALELLPILEQEASARQTSGKKLTNVEPKGKASHVAAQLVKTNSAYVAAVKAIGKVAPELIEKVRAGSLSVPDAKQLAEIPKKKRQELLKSNNGTSHNGEILRAWKKVVTPRAPKPVARPIKERKNRIKATTLIHGDCRKELKNIPSQSVDAVVTDSVYPEVRPRGESYPRIHEGEWQSMMEEVLQECRRVLKPRGSAVFVLQPNAEKIGQMRLWLWRFMVWAGENWNVIEDCYWWNPTAIPARGCKRAYGLMRPSVKTCVWLGPPDCYRNQDRVLWTPSDALAAKSREVQARIVSSSGVSCRNNTVTAAADARGGTTPFNLLPISANGRMVGNGGHPAVTPYEVAAWWCKYILPPGGVLLDPFCGSGTMLAAALDHGASRVIGIDRERTYLKIAKQRIEKG